jgi:hypothetical protein
MNLPDDSAFEAAFHELWRMVVEGQTPNGTPPDAFGPYREMIEDLRLAYTSQAQAADLLRKAGRDPGDPIESVRRAWSVWSAQELMRPLQLAVQQAAASREANPADLRWLEEQVTLIPAGKDGAELRALLQPALERIVGFDDDVLVVAALDALRKHFAWKGDTFRAYRDSVVKARKRRAAEQRPVEADAPTESEELGESEPPPIFLSPALAEHAGVVYLSHKMAFKSTKRKKDQAITTTVWKPIILTSDRRRIIPAPPPIGADVDSVWWLDQGQRLALAGGFSDAPEKRWSYDSIVLFLNGAEPSVAAHEVYDALMASLRRYVYHADEYSYVVDVLWTMGTYFYRLWNAYPYLALHGEKGAGKTTLLTWLWAVCFNAEFVVNTSEASLYRSIQAKAPTLLIDEQEGLNSSKAAKEQKADLMGLLKSGYKAGAKVARQRMDRPELTEYFDVYSPKALAAIELFEDVLENRAILTFMSRKPAAVATDDDGAIIARYATEFGDLRDALYVLLMHEAQNIRKITARVRTEYHNRFKELFLPLYAMAGLVDLSRGQGRQTLDALDIAAKAKADIRRERDMLTPEAALREALRLLCESADDDDTGYGNATVQDDGCVLFDTLQVKEVFESLYSSSGQSFYNDTWFGRQVLKLKEAVRVGSPRRRWRKVSTGLMGESETKYVCCYVVDPAALSQHTI